MNLDDILKQVPVDDIAERFGVSPDVARRAAEEGGAALLGGLAKNAETAEGSSAIEKALSRHEGFTGASSVDDVDAADGEKIIGHVFGGDEKQVVEGLTASEKTAGGIDFGKLLPVLAPIVMGLIANANKDKSGGGGIGDLIGGLLSGGQNGGGQNDGGLAGSIGDLLGGLLGGRK